MLEANPTAKDPMKKKFSKYPEGWSGQQIKDLAEHCEAQCLEAAVAEDEAAYLNTRLTMMALPVKLVPKVQKLISKWAG